HAAVAGAPVTLQELYDTHYTERYLGHPAAEPEVYRRNSVLWDADKLERPLLLIHGLSDDNVYVAHTLRLSAALFEAGRYHELVLLPNATHMTRSDAVTENVLRIQLDFLRRSLSGGTDAPRLFLPLSRSSVTLGGRTPLYAERARQEETRVDHRPEVRRYLGRRRRPDPGGRRPHRALPRERPRRGGRGLGHGRHDRRPVDAGAGDLAGPRAPRARHAAHGRRADRHVAPRDRRERPGLPGRLLHRLAGRDHHRHAARPGQDRRDPTQAHQGVARGRQRRDRGGVPGALDQ